MCGRFGLATPEYSETRFQARLLPDIEPLLVPRYNIAPTQDVLVVASSKRLGGDRGLKAMKWGLVAEWALNNPGKPRPINVKVEGIMDRPYFRRLLDTRRCIIPADGFYEWDKRRSSKQPWNIRLLDGSQFGFAGLWDACKTDQEWLVSCTILTTSANELVAQLHDRMPMILAPDLEAVWLSPDARADDLAPFLNAYPAPLMESYPVSGAVGDVNNDSAQLRQRVDAAPAQLSLI